MLLTAARAILSDTRLNGAVVRECIEYGIAQKPQSLTHILHVTARLAHMHTKNEQIMRKSFYMYIYVHDRVQKSNAVVYRVI